MAISQLPTFEPQQPAESRMEYASRVLRFLIDTECTAACSDDDLVDARWIALFAVAAKDISPAAVDRIAAVSRLCEFMLRCRAEDAARLLQALEPATIAPSAPAGRDKPNLGPMAGVLPRPIVNPPAPALAIPPAVNQQRQKVDIAF